MEANFGDKMFDLCRKLMLSLGFWDILDNMNPKILPLYKVYTYLTRTYLFVVFVLLFIELYRQLFILHDYDRGLQLASTHIIIGIICLKLRIYMNKNVVELIREGITVTNSFNKMDNDVKNIVQKQLSVCNSANWPIVVICLITGSSFDVARIILARQLENENRTEDFLNFTYNPLDNFTLFVHLENTVAIFFSVLNCALQSLLNTIIINMVTQIKVLQYQFSTYDANENPYSHGDNETKIFLKLRKLIIIHQNLISYVEQLNGSIANAVLIEYLISSITIAFTVITISKQEYVYFFSAVLLVTTLQMYLFCTNADDIISESMELGTAIYNSRWYERSQSIKKIILIVMMRTKLPLSLKIGKFGILDARSMISICKAAHSYLSLFHGSN